MIAYTLGFVIRGDEILMLNREKSPWKGAWNGVGGKLQPHETPLECIRRELLEETGIEANLGDFEDKGLLTWTDFEAIGNGLRIFFLRVDDRDSLVTPMKTKEGILDWKKIEWIVDLKNEGVAKNIPLFLPELLAQQNKKHIHCVFENGRLKSVSIQPLEE
jgi:8-oxo-dGTP diphosphatase